MLGRLSERKGTAAVIRITTILALAVPLIALVLNVAGHQQPVLARGGYVLIYTLIGAIDASFLIGFLAYVLDIAPPGERTAYTGLANTLGGLTVVAPALGGIILQLTSYPVLFVCAAMGGIMSLLTVSKLPAALLPDPKGLAEHP
jgi:MFS family permease